MSISRLTALMIKNGKTTIRVVGPVENKYGWDLDYWKNDSPHIAPLLSATPHYDTPEEAEAAANEVVRLIKKAKDL